MRCDRTRKKLQEYITGELTDSEQQSIEQHLSSCHECRREERLMRLLIASLDSDALVQPSPSFVESVVEELPKTVSPSRPRVLQYLAALEVGCVLLIGYLYGDILVSWTRGLRDSLAYLASRLDPAPLFDTSFSPRIEVFYFTAMGFAALLVIAAILWFTRYYRKPLYYN